MKNLFKYAFAVFMVSGILTITLLINESIVFSAGPIAKTTVATYEKMIIIFKICGLCTLATFPIIVNNVIVRAYQDRYTAKEGQKIVLVGIGYGLIFFIMPAIVFINNEMFHQLGVLVMTHVVAIIIGGKGNKSPLPTFWK